MTIITEDAEPISRTPTGAIAEYLRQSISVSSILQQMWSGRWLIIAGFVLGLCDGAYTVWTRPALFSASMRVSPAEGDTGGGEIGGGSGSGGLLADLTGSLGSNKVPKFLQFTLGYSSSNVANLLDRRYGMLCRVYKDECDIATHTWRPRTDWRARIGSFFAWLGHLPDPNAGRTTIDLANYIHDSVKLEQSKQNAVATFSYTNRDPRFAAEFLSKVVQGTNDYIKQQNQGVQHRFVDYLTASAAKTTNVEQRMAIDALLLQNERQLMLTEVDVPYAAQIMDGPTVVPVYNVPRTLAVYAFMGLLVGLIAAACRNLIPRRWRFW